METLLVDYLERLQILHEDFIATFADLPAEALDWQPGADMNSLCVLVVHTTGSARYWIGLAVDDVPDRNRDMEFQARGLSNVELKARFAKLETYVQGALERVTSAELEIIRARPEYRDEQVTSGWALLHALEHTGLHLGHAQITRQLWQQR